MPVAPPALSSASGTLVSPQGSFVREVWPPELLTPLSSLDLCTRDVSSAQLRSFAYILLESSPAYHSFLEYPQVCAESRQSVHSCRD